MSKPFLCRLGFHSWYDNVSMFGRSRVCNNCFREEGSATSPLADPRVVDAIFDDARAVVKAERKNRR